MKRIKSDIMSLAEEALSATTYGTLAVEIQQKSESKDIPKFRSSNSDSKRNSQGSFLCSGVILATLLICGLALSSRARGSIILRPSALAEANFLWPANSNNPEILGSQGQSSTLETDSNALSIISYVPELLHSQGQGSSAVRNPNALSIIFLRHAKSSWENPSLPDFDRQLNASGVEDADRLGRYLQAQNVPAPDLILSSPSVRTKQTLDIVKKHWATQVPINYDERLYSLAFGWYFDVYRTLGINYRRIMLVGHNPAIEATAKYLLGKIGDDSFHVPTGTFLEMEVTANSWDALVERSCTEVLMVSPKITSAE